MRDLTTAVLFLAVFPGITASLGAERGPLTPEQARAGFQVDAGLKVELVAAEPLVASPVALCFDERGRMFVAENRDYPTGPAAGKPPGGTIAMLEDTDHDGRMDKRSEFVTGLTFPNGVMPWQGGLIVTCAPDVFYFKDTDGDGRADVRRVLFTGFSTDGSTQLRVSHPTLGADGWVYLTSGFTRPGRIITPEHPDRPALALQSDSRFNPFTLEIVPEDGRAQFGLTFDNFGRRFICYNRVQVQHVVLPSRYLKRNASLAFSRTIQDVPANRQRDWVPSAEGFASRTYPLSENVTTFDSHAGSFTAACGVHVFGGDGLPGEYRGDVFSCDPTGNLVHRDRLTATGPTFSSRMVNEGREFLASADNWFRPVNLAEGPDGALYVCDMYRKNIEHPEYLPEETRKHADFESGKGLGRIWRVMSETAQPKRNDVADRSAQLESADTRQLAAALSHSNAWRRQTAHRLLLEQKPPQAAKFLTTLARNSRSLAEGRFLALNLLESLGALDESSLARALADAHPGVRELALRFAESRLQNSAKLAKAVQRLADDSDPRVRFQCALTLGEISSAAPLAALARVAVRDGADEWARAAILSSLNRRALAFLEILLKQNAPRKEVEFMTELCRLAGTEGSATELSRIVGKLADTDAAFIPALRIAALEGLIAGARSRQLALPLDRALPLAEPARELLSDATQSIPVRKAAAGFLAGFGATDAAPLLLEVLDPREPAELQQAALRLLASMTDPGAVQALLARERWPVLAPATRATVITTLLGQPRLTLALLHAVESGQIPTSVLTSRQRDQLRQHSDSAVRERSQKLLAASGGNRMQAYEESKAALQLQGASANGKKIFGAQCASCHRLDREGVIVGPDLVSIRRQAKDVILLHVIHPNYEIAPPFVAYEAETTDGRNLTGLLASETPASVTLRQAQGIEETIRRADLKKLMASPLSLMPEELEKNMTKQELADLLAYLRGE